MHFLAVIDQQFGAPIQLVGDIEQMFGQAVGCQTRQQCSTDPKVYFGARAFGDQRVGRFSNPVMEECIRSLQAKNHPGADGIPQRCVNLFFGLPKSQTQ